MDFRDEVDTPLDMNAWDRFAKYRGIKNIKTAEWDPFENLPMHYAKIYRF
jgi:pre-rRNA-processing protein TSR1